MSIHNFRLLAFALVFFLVTPSSFAEPRPRTRTCLHVAMNMGEGARAVKAFWNGTERVTVDTPQGPQAFAFGFDAELWHVSDVLNLINKDPRAREAAAAIMREATELQFTRAKMRTMLGLSNDELNDAVKATKRDARKLTFADVKVRYLKNIKHGSEEKSVVAEALSDVVTQALANRGIKVTAVLEESSGSTEQGPLGTGSAVELVMDGAMTSPKEFRDIIKKFLFKDTEFPETHFHLSVPSAAVTTQQMLLAARALETKIILEELMAELKNDGTLSPYDASALATPLNSDTPFVDRGVVRIEPNRWHHPAQAHDVEIRQWLSADNGLNNVQFMIKLVQNASRLRDTSRFTGKAVEDIAPSNLNASLRYAALILKDRLPEGKAHVPDKLNAFAKEIENTENVTPAQRRKIVNFFKQENLMKYLTIESFLNEE